MEVHRGHDYLRGPSSLHDGRSRLHPSQSYQRRYQCFTLRTNRHLTCCHFWFVEPVLSVYWWPYDTDRVLMMIGSWVISSMLALDPWHLLTCMLQYMWVTRVPVTWCGSCSLSFYLFRLLAPAYINVLNVYAFANLVSSCSDRRGFNLFCVRSSTCRLLSLKLTWKSSPFPSLFHYSPSSPFAKTKIMIKKIKARFFVGNERSKHCSHRSWNRDLSRRFKSRDQ